MTRSIADRILSILMDEDADRREQAVAARAPHESLPADVRTLQAGDLVNLEGVDLSTANDWTFEYAQVEAVSTYDAPSGGWLDGQLRTIDGSPNGYAIIYVTNGVAPALVIDRRNQ